MEKKKKKKTQFLKNLYKSPRNTLLDLSQFGNKVRNNFITKNKKWVKDYMNCREQISNQFNKLKFCA